MMESKELRIGNYVAGGVLHTGIGYDYYEISYLTEQCAFFNQSNLGEYYKDLKPISLTEDWLINFGFDWVTETSSWVKLQHEVVPFVEGFGFCPHCNENHVQIDFVHQLQNLYFALTGEELTITLAAGKNK